MKKLMTIRQRKSGRDSSGHITVRHQGGGHKRYTRDVDFKRDKRDIWARVEAIEYDPNRNANLALLVYADGERRYTIAPLGLAVGAKLISSDVAPLESGNTLPLKRIPVGMQIHNLEIRPGKGAQIVKAAGSVAIIQGKEDAYILVKLPSGEIRRFDPECYATLGQVGNVEDRTRVIRKAGTMRRMGKRPQVRGVAMHPAAHPHGGGEGRSGVGRKRPMTVYGRAAVGRTRNKTKYSKDLIVQRRKPGKHSHN
jgi:large subunit ribosomal protein L2